jgi:hypothetical protein
MPRTRRNQTSGRRAGNTTQFSALACRYARSIASTNGKDEAGIDFNDDPPFGPGWHEVQPSSLPGPTQCRIERKDWFDKHLGAAVDKRDLVA